MREISTRKKPGTQGTHVPGTQANQWGFQAVSCVWVAIPITSLQEFLEENKNTLLLISLVESKIYPERKGPVLSIMLHVPLLSFWFAQERGFYCLEAREESIMERCSVVLTFESVDEIL